jgi:AraC family transcriptional regulator
MAAQGDRPETATNWPNPACGLKLPGLFVGRSDLERSTGMVDAPSQRHAVVVHNSGPLDFHWRAGGRTRHSVMFRGCVLVNPAGYIEQRAWDQRTEDIRVGLPVDSAYLGTSTSSLRPGVGVHDPLLAQLGRYLAKSLEMGASADSLYADALAHALGAHVVGHYGGRSTMRQDRVPDTLCWRQLEQVYDYIESNLHQALTVTELATVAGISPTHFTRLFRQHTGEPPHRFVRNRRLDRAERLIAGTQLPLREVALAVGFSDQSHLNRLMRATRGVTPGQLRDSTT